MNIIVSDAGFTADAFTGETVTLENIAAHDGAHLALNVTQTTALADILPHLARAKMIRIAFPAFNDGRGFTLARRLRLAGYKGTLRAAGHVIADQYAMARRSGFDAVEIAPDLAARQPAAQWQFRADWQAHDYQSRLRGQTSAQTASQSASQSASIAAE